MITQDIYPICEAISKLRTPKDVQEFFGEIFTESEINDVAQRWNILKMLSKNDSQRTISKALSVSLCKVTRGAKILKNEQSLTRKILFDESWQK